MSDLPDKPAGGPPQDFERALVEVEVLPATVGREPQSRGVTLTGAVARDVRDSVGSVAVESLKAGRRASETTLRLVAPDHLRQGLADDSLRWATASKGDASVLIKDTTSGHIAGHGELHKVRTSPAKVLGPAMWEAMAMATQQHYLAEIDKRLQAIETGVNEGLSRDDDDKLGALAKVHSAVVASHARLAEGKSLSSGRVEELRGDLRRADEVWHQLYKRTARQVDAYRRGDPSTSADSVEHSWNMLLEATQVLAESSALLTALPYETLGELEDATSEERERAAGIVGAVQGLAGELHNAHLEWQARNAEWNLHRALSPARRAVGTVRRRAPAKPTHRPLAPTAAWHMQKLAAPPPPPRALVVSVNDADGTVAVAAESA